MADVFRKEHQEVGLDKVLRCLRVTELCERLHEVLSTNKDLGADGRCISLAVTKLEEACMWAVKGITAPQEK